LIEYESLIQNWRLKPNENFEDYPWKITDEIYKDNIDMVNKTFKVFEFKFTINILFKISINFKFFKTYHYLRLRELLQEYSKTSCLVVL